MKISTVPREPILRSPSITEDIKVFKKLSRYIMSQPSLHMTLSIVDDNYLTAIFADSGQLSHVDSERVNQVFANVARL
jgi:hypothetical protein